MTYLSFRYEDWLISLCLFPSSALYSCWNNCTGTSLPVQFTNLPLKVLNLFNHWVPFLSFISYSFVCNLMSSLLLVHSSKFISERTAEGVALIPRCASVLLAVLFGLMRGSAGGRPGRREWRGRGDGVVTSQAGRGDKRWMMKEEKLKEEWQR